MLINQTNEWEVFENSDFTIFNFNNIFINALKQTVKQFENLYIYNIYIIYNANRFYKSFEKDIKRFLLHYIFTEIIEKYKNNKNTKKIILIPLKQSKTIFIDPITLKLFISILKYFKQVQNNLPFVFYIDKQNIDLFNKQLGETKELMQNIQNIYKKHTYKNNNNKKFKKFIKKHGLLSLCEMFENAVNLYK